MPEISTGTQEEKDSFQSVQSVEEIAVAKNNTAKEPIGDSSPKSSRSDLIPHPPPPGPQGKPLLGDRRTEAIRTCRKNFPSSVRDEFLSVV